MTQAELIYNAHAGRVIAWRELRSAIEYLEGSGWAVVVHETHAPRQATALARQAVQRGAEVVIAAGGDGTVNEVASGLVHSETAMGVLPVGTANVWALQMHIPAPNPLALNSTWTRLASDLQARMDDALHLSHYRSALLDAARVLVEGSTRAVDLGQANERYFLLWAGIGLDAAVTEHVSPESKKALGPLALVGTALDMARHYKNVDVTLTLDGQPRAVRTSLIVVSNIRLYGAVLPLGARAYVDDGLLDVCVFKGEGLLNFVQQVFRVATRQHVAPHKPGQNPRIEYYQASKVLVESGASLPVHVDDEPFARTPVTLCVLPRALQVRLPNDAPDNLFIDRGPGRA
jgi:diacylglycerol kinase family enzyme